MTICKNCNNHFKGNFCNNCGQGANTHRLSMHYIWHDIQHGLFHFDNGIFYTVKELLTRPGDTIREFLEGKRVRHFKPFSFVVVLATFYGLLYHYLVSHLSDSKPINSKENILNAYVTVIRWTTDHFAISTLLLIVITTIVSYFIFKKRGYDFAEHLVLNTYICGLILIFSILLFPLIYIFRGTETLKWYGIFVQWMDLCLMYWCYSQFFNKLSRVKCLGLTFLTFFLSSGITVLIGYFAGWFVGIIMMH